MEGGDGEVPLDLTGISYLDDTMQLIHGILVHGSSKLLFVQDRRVSPFAPTSEVLTPCQNSRLGNSDTALVSFPSWRPVAIIIIFITRLGRDLVMLVPEHALGRILSNLVRQIKMPSYSFRC